MTRLIHAELLKIRTTKLVWGMLALTLSFVAMGVLPLIFLADRGSEDALPPLTDPDMVRTTYSSATGGILFVMLLGVIGITGEYRHKTITQAFLTTPRRHRVVLAKLGSYLLTGAVFGVVAVALTVAVAWPGIAIRDGLASPLDNDVPTVLGGSVLASALYAWVGLGLGALIRHQVAAILVAIGWALVVEGVLTLALPEAAKWLPGGAVRAITESNVGQGGDTVDLLPAWGGTLLLLGYGLAFALAASFTTTRRDIT